MRYDAYDRLMIQPAFHESSLYVADRKILKTEDASIFPFTTECDESSLPLFMGFPSPCEIPMIDLQITDHDCYPTSPVCGSLSELVPVYSRRVPLAACGYSGARHCVTDHTPLSMTTALPVIS